MSNIQLQRNSEIFYSSVDLLTSTADVMTPSNTWKLDILSGFAVSAEAATIEITHNQHGAIVDRSKQSFTNSRNAVDWNFTTYMRCTGAERRAIANVVSENTSASGNAKPLADWFMWQALVSNTAPAAVGEQSTWYKQGQLSTVATLSDVGSHASTSQSVARPEGILYFKLDNLVYQVANAIVDSATLSAGIAEIVTTEWTGKGSRLVELQGESRDRAISVFGGTLNNGTTIVANSNVVTLTQAASYHPYGVMNVAGAISTATYIKNRLSTIELSYNTNNYVFPVTAFSLEYKNDVAYLDRNTLGTVNNVVVGYSTSRSVSGSLSMYLRSGANSSAQFLREISSSTELNTANIASATIYIGGTTAPYVYTHMPAVHFTYPTISTEDVINLSTNFTAQETQSRSSDEFILVAARFGFSPFALFEPGDRGWWYDINDVSTLFQDSTATTPVTLSGQPVGAILDKSGKGINATQATSTARPTYATTPSRVTLDAVDDNMTVNIGSAFTGTVIQGTPGGILHYDINVSSGTWSFTVNPLYVADSAITGVVAIDRALTEAELINSKTYLKTRGAGDNFISTTSMADWFRERTDVTNIYADTWDTANVNSFNAFAYDAINLTTLDVSNWNTTNVTSFGSFARIATNLTMLDVSNWNTANVTAFNNFAQNTYKLTTLDVSNWNTARVTNFGSFVNGANNITMLDVSNWNTANVTSFNSFALNATNLTTLDVSNWNIAKVTNFASFVSEATNLTTLDVSNWNTANVATFASFVSGANNITNLNVSNWNTANVATFASFALSATNLTTLDVSNWDTAKVTTFSNFVNGATNLTTLNVSNWNTANVTTFASFVNSARNLTTLDTSNWVTNNVTTFNSFAINASNLTSLAVSSWNTSNVTTFFRFAQNATNLTTVTVNGGTGTPFADSPCVNYTSAFSGTNLTQQSIDDILVAINAAGTSSGTFNQSGGSAPSITGESAITALRSRGWTITVTGGF